MTDISETALAFCKECMATKAEARRGLDDFPQVHYEDESGDGRRRFYLFDYERLATVLDAAAAFIERAGLHLRLEIRGDQQQVVIGDEHEALGHSTDTDICHALMAACLEAQRKLARAA